MFQYGIVILAIFGIYSVASDNHACATTEKITMVNGVISNLSQTLGSIVDNSSLSETQKNQMVLDKVCNDTMNVRANVDKVEMEYASCQALINMTNVGDLSFGALKFLDLFERFTGVNNFCECVPAVMQAMAMNLFKDQLMYMMQNAPYPAINVNVMCNSDPIKNAVMVVADHSAKCSHVWKYADILNSNNVQIMNNFRRTQCSVFDQTKFMCAMTASATMDFKSCITEADKASSNDEKRCERHMCAMNMSATCDVGRVWFMHAVNMEKTTGEPFQLDASKCETSGVTITLASFSVLLTSVFSLFFL